VTESSTPDVSVVLPVHNEAEHLGQEIERIRSALDRSRYRYEIILVDDGSTDGSLEVARSLEGIRLIECAVNRGSGHARRVGTRAARGDVVVWTDVDMTYPNGQIPELVDALDGDDQVVGARRTEEGTHKLLRVPAKFLIRKLASYLVKTPIPDLNSGFRAFRRRVALQFLHLLPHGFSCVTTITLAFLANGYSVRYMPIDYAPRAGESKFHWWRDTKKYALQVVRMVMTYNPLAVFMPVGLLLLLFATGKLGFDWWTRDFRLSSNTLLLFFAGFNIVITGLLADLVARVNAPSEEQVPPASVSHLGGAVLDGDMRRSVHDGETTQAIAGDATTHQMSERETDG
jgi:polyisoprenyl-phosphate glycosyltransferase